MLLQTVISKRACMLYKACSGWAPSMGRVTQKWASASSVHTSAIGSHSSSSSSGSAPSFLALLLLRSPPYTSSCLPCHARQAVILSSFWSDTIDPSADLVIMRIDRVVYHLLISQECGTRFGFLLHTALSFSGRPSVSRHLLHARQEPFCAFFQGLKDLSRCKERTSV